MVLRAGEPGYLSAGGACSDSRCVEVDRETSLWRGNGSSRLAEEHAEIDDPRERAVELAAMTAATLADVSDRCDPALFNLYLDDPPFDYGRLRHARAAEDRRARLASLRAEREAQIRPLYELVAGNVERLGGTTVGGMLTTAAITVELPECAIREVAALSQVLGVERTGQSPRPTADGIDRRAAMGMGLTGPAGIDGEDGGDGGTANTVRYGVIEADNSINRSHVSFRDTSTGVHRITDTDRCAYWVPSNRCINSATTSSSTHGTSVTSVLLSDLFDGQDSAFGTDFWGMLGRGQRTGIVQEAEVHYYSAKFNDHVATAIDEATFENDIDIINLSTSLGQGSGAWCNNAESHGTRAAIRAAENAGVLVVVSAGNNGDLTGCTVGRMATYPDSMAIAATNDADSLTDMDTVSRRSDSSNGYFNSTLDGGVVALGAPIDLAAVGSNIELVAGAGSSGYTNAGAGTSFAAPQVAGAAGLTYDWVYNRGGLSGLEQYPYTIRALLLAMGDGRDSTGTHGYTVDDDFGYGNLRWVDLDSELGSGGAWGVRRLVLDDGDVAEWIVGDSGPESTSVMGWKFAAIIGANQYGGSPDMLYELVDTCPSGGGEVVVRSSNSRHPLKGRLRMRGSEMASMFHGRCLVVRVTVESADSSFPLYAVDYYYTNARVNHDAD